MTLSHSTPELYSYTEEQDFLTNKKCFESLAEGRRK